MDKDRLTTIVGAVGAAAMAAGPVISGATNQSLHTGDYTQLVAAVFMAILGFFTNKK